MSEGDNWRKHRDRRTEASRSADSVITITRPVVHSTICSSSEWTKFAQKARNLSSIITRSKTHMCPLDNFVVTTSYVTLDSDLHGAVVMETDVDRCSLCDLSKIQKDTHKSTYLSESDNIGQYTHVKESSDMSM